MSLFADHTAVTPTDEPGAFDCEIHPEWFVERGPNGGNVAAIVTRALAATFETGDRPLRSLTLHYVRAPQAGPAQVVVETTRSGRSVTFATASLRQGGDVHATAQAVLAVEGESLELHTPIALPDLPPDDHEPHPPASQMPPFARNFEYVFTESPSHDAPAVSGGWLRLRDPAPLDEPQVVALTDSWIPALYAFAGRVLAVPTLDLTVHVRAPLPRPAGWAFVRVQSREASHGFMEEDAVVVAPDGTLLAQSRQLALVR